MKKYLMLLSSIIALGLLSCSNQTNNIEKSQESSKFPLEINTFTFEQLFQAGGGGCGMVLWKSGTTPKKDGILFFHGLGETFLAMMILDGEIIDFNRTDASGKEFYGQQTSQKFVSEDGKITISVNVTLGKAGEIESVNIPEGTISISTKGQTKNIPVVGDAGC